MENTQIEKALSLSNQETEPQEKKCKSATTLRVVGNIVLIFGIIISFCLLLASLPREGFEQIPFNIVLFLYSFCFLLSTVTIWAFARAVAEIAENTRKQVSNIHK